MVSRCLLRGLGEAGGLPLTAMLPGAAVEDEEGRITEGDLAPETSGAEELEVDLDPDSPEAVDLGDVGVGGAAVSSGLADVSEVIICWPATL